jgi:hypothetical protein
MKRFLLVILFITLSLLLIPAPVRAEGQVISHPETIYTGAEDGVLCLPGIYLHDTGDCTPAGPSTYLTEMAEMGITLPLTPLPAKKPDFALTYVDVRYGQVRTTNAPVYPSVEAALKGDRKQAVRRIDSPFSYISYTDDVVIDGKRFYMIEPGAWMTANDIIRIGSVPLFQGVTLARTPNHAFGWVLSYLSSGPVETKRTPGYQNDDYTGHTLNNHEVVPVFTETQVGDTTWYQIAPNEWLPEKVVARVIPNTTPPEGVTGDRWIEVNLYEQTIAVYDQRELVFATLVASGLEPFWTQPGVFQIYDKFDSAPMRGSFEADRSDAYYLEDVPWTMYFDQARALHGAYWRANLGFPQSHGCVNLSVGDSRWLFDWADIGDWVYVWDPSGQTPADPNYYTAGGA